MPRRVEVTNVFERTFDATARTVINVGGSRSSKSYSIIQLLIMLAQNEPCKIGVFRKTMPALRRTSYRDFINTLLNYKIYSPEAHNKSADTYRLGGSLIDFIGLDEPDKIKSSEFNFTWLEEANEFTKEDYLILSTRLSAKPVSGRRNQILLSLNPSEAHGWVHDWLMPQSDVAVIKSSYHDNPFLPSDYITLLENLKETDPESYQVYALGEWGKTGRQIYSRYTLADSPPENPDEIIYGLDFGYNNPSALVCVHIKDGEVWLEELLYQTGLTNTALLEKVKDIIPEEHRLRCLYADSAEPARIEEFSQAGFNIMPADKSVLDGIDTVKSCKLHILKSSVWLLKEIQCYQYKVGKDGNTIDEPVKFQDHCFIAGTEIETSKGSIPIEKIEHGDYVLTRQGFRKVLSVGITSPLADVFDFVFSDGTVLSATPTHPIFSDGEFAALQDLTHCDTFSIIKICQKKSCSMESLIGVILKAKIAVKGFIRDLIPGTSEKVSRIFIEKFGNTITEKFRRVFISTIKTAMDLIIALKICKPCLALNTYGNILKIANGLNQTLVKNTWRKYDRLQKIGIVAKQGGFGIPYTQKNLILENASESLKNVCAVKKNFSDRNEPGHISVPTNVNRHTEEKKALTISRVFANSAAENLPSINTQKPRVVLKLVRVKIITTHARGKLPVYNLTIDGEPEYFANGILVHNCMDATRYAVRTHLKGRNTPNVTIL